MPLQVAGQGPPSSIEESATFYAKRILKHVYEALPSSPTASKLSATFHVACLDVLTNSLGCKRLQLELTQVGAWGTTGPQPLSVSLHLATCGGSLRTRLLKSHSLR